MSEENKEMEGAASEPSTPEQNASSANEAQSTASEFAEGLKSAGGDNKKVLAGILAIFVGWAGVHKFILGYQKEGIIMLVASILGFVLSCIGIGILVIWATGLIGLIEGIIYLTKSDNDFYEIYQKGRRPWF